jgi:hypothetical protein
VSLGALGTPSTPSVKVWLACAKRSGEAVNSLAGVRLTGVERADATNIRIPVEGAPAVSEGIA